MPDRSFYTRMGRLSAIVTILPSAMAAGWLLGYLLDRLAGTFPLLAIVTTLIGAGAGFYQIAKILAREQRGQDGGSPPGKA